VRINLHFINEQTTLSEGEEMDIDAVSIHQLHKARTIADLRPALGVKQPRLFKLSPLRCQLDDALRLTTREELLEASRASLFNLHTHRHLILSTPYSANTIRGICSLDARLGKEVVIADV
jgi:hypothetical protein